MSGALKAPFPYFGGKSRIASLVWERFGTVSNLIDPFFGSGAILFGAPWPADRTETVNDADGHLANFFRALQYAPDEVAYYADAPVNEIDLHSWHKTLVSAREHVERMLDDPKYFDAELAGKWVWGTSQWIGTGWCPRLGAASAKTPHLGNAGLGPHRASLARGFTKDGDLWKPRPNLGSGVGSQGNGVHGKRLSRRMPAVGAYFGSEDHPGMDNARGGHRAHHDGMPLYDYFRALAARLRRTRVVCGDFERILGPSVTWWHGLSAIFLDPPYADAEHSIAYAGGGNVWPRVTRWCETNGDHPLLRVALCGYEGTWEPPAGWEAVKWRTPGGYGSQGNRRGKENAAREVVWFNKSCLNAIEDLPLWREQL